MPGTSTTHVITTSGSTGVGKKVVLRREALQASAEATARRIGEGRWLLALPVNYVAGLQVLVRSEFAGTEPVAVEGSFRAAAFVEATKQLGSQHDLFTALVPAQLSTLLQNAGDNTVLKALRAYRAILVGGQALSLSLREQAEELGVRIVRTYGSTETSGGCVYDGVPLDIATVRTVNGELQIAGPMLADEYRDDPAGTARAFISDEGKRWYRTGDLGVFEDNLVRVQGRADNVIISGGINISLDRVEHAVRGISALSEAVVVSVSDERWGEASVIIAPQKAEYVDDGMRAQLLEEARRRVAEDVGRPARPARLLLVEALPTLSSGKPDRLALRRLAESS